MSIARQIAKNAGALTAARGVTGVLTLVTTVYLGRTLGPSAYGILTWGFALYTYFAYVPNLGLNVYGVRESARDASRIEPLVGRILGLRVLLATATYTLFLGVVVSLDKPSLFKLVVAVQGLAIFSHMITLEWVFESVQQMGKLATRNVIVAVATLAGTLYFVRSEGDVVLAAAITVVAIAGANVWLLFTYRRQFGSLRPRFDWRTWPPMIRSGLPIAVSIFVLSLYTSMDQLMLGLMRSDQEVGWYGAGFRLVTAAMIPSQIILQAFMPSLSAALGDSEAMRARARGFAITLVTVGLPLMATGALLAPNLILLFGDQFAPAAPALALLMLNVGIAYVHLTFGRALIAWDRERLYMYILVAGGVLNIGLNFVLISAYGMTGAALATIASEGAVTLAVAVLFRRIVGTVFGLTILRGLLATALGVGGPYALSVAFSWPLLLTLLLIGLGYAGAAIALRLVDVTAVRRLLSRTPS